MKRLLAALAFALSSAAFADGALFSEGCVEGDEFGFDRWYVGATGDLVLPQGGSRLRRLGGASLLAGHYFTDAVALEGALSWHEDRAGFAVRALCHARAWELYDRLFGFSAFDPFVTLGARGWLPEGTVGPSAGIGALYYLDDHWALRFDADATLGLDSDVALAFVLATGVQFSF